MKSDIIPKEYKGKSKNISWPPSFNKKLKPQKLADLYFLKMDYGLRPYFQNSSDFESFNQLRIQSNSQQLVQFIPKPFEYPNFEQNPDLISKKVVEGSTKWRNNKFNSKIGTLKVGFEGLNFEEREKGQTTPRRIGDKNSRRVLFGRTPDNKKKEKKKNLSVPKKRGFFSRFGCSGPR